MNQKEELKEEKHDLIIKIQIFIDNYAIISPNFDPEKDDDLDKYVGPDIHEFITARKRLINGEIPNIVHSNFYSGCYKNNHNARNFHDGLIERIKNYRQKIHDIYNLD